MGSLKLTTASSGSVILSPANTASDVTITVPAATTTMVGTDTTQTLTNKTLTSPTFTTPNIDSAQFATVSGTAPLYACRAWVNFNGTGTVAIRASGNVSSITDLGTGTYRVNFSTAMPDANYVVTGSAGASNNNYNFNKSNAPLAGSCDVVSIYTGVSYNDEIQMHVAIFR